jgi:hypothetical protein
MCGVAAPLVYVTAIILGGALNPGYSHLSMAVSELIESGAPNTTLLDILFCAYGVLLIAFAWAEGMSVRGDGLRLLSAGCVILGIIGLLGIIMTLFFPMDPRGAPQTAIGIIHLVLAGAVSLATILTVAFLGLGSKTRDGFWVYSLVSTILLVLAGVAAAVLAVMGHPLLGLAERLAIGMFLQWILAFAVRLLLEDSGIVG